MKSHALFDDDFANSELPTETDEHCCSHRPSTRAVVLLLSTVFAVCALSYGYGYVERATGIGRKPVRLTGDHVGKLKPGMPIVSQGVTVGQVGNILIHDGQPTADLVFREDQQITPSDYEFQVASVNKFVPGNLGIVATPRPKPNGSALDNSETRAATNVDIATHDDPVADSSIVQTVPSLLPPEAPSGFVAVIAVAVTATLAVIAIKVLRILLVPTLVLAFVTVALALFSRTSGLNSETPASLPAEQRESNGQLPYTTPEPIAPAEPNRDGKHTSELSHVLS
ncbi:MAG: MCE family protein, partial [Planctomycetales bacterium]|nr:MCE family protein [Planctomycetales bacterium]